MRTHCPANERIKREYLTYLKEAQRYSETSINGVAAAIAHFERYGKHKDFKRFRIQQAIGFKKKLAEDVNRKTGRLLSLATQRSTLNALRSFFIWLAGQPGYKSRLSYPDADYFNLSEKDNRIAQSHTPRPFPSLTQARHMITEMPSATPIEQRDRALIAFTLMTGCRDRATVSLKLKHIDLANKRVSLDAREVQTKNS
ncbi:MAG: site-specific integrase, partial [Pseudomonadota bacterium]